MRLSKWLSAGTIQMFQYSVNIDVTLFIKLYYFQLYLDVLELNLIVLLFAIINSRFERITESSLYEKFVTDNKYG